MKKRYRTYRVYVKQIRAEAGAVPFDSRTAFAEVLHSSPAHGDGHRLQAWHGREAPARLT